jgi:hypothetical protein
MVRGDGVAYGVEVYPSESRETVFTPGASAYRLLCIPVKAPPRTTEAAKAKATRRRPARPKPVWERRVPIRVTALVRARDRLFVAGPPDMVDPADPHGAWEGRKGGRLAVFAAVDGETLAEYRLPAPPVWDGMAASRGRLYLALLDGTIVCFGKK